MEALQLQDDDLPEVVLHHVLGDISGAVGDSVVPAWEIRSTGPVDPQVAAAVAAANRARASAAMRGPSVHDIALPPA